MSNDKEMPFYKRLWFGVGLLALILINSTIIIGYYVVNSYEKERDEATTKSISEILKQESIAHPILPDVLVVNIASKSKKQISDSIKSELVQYLTNRYTKRIDDNSSIDIHPYVSFLEKTNNKPITGEQVEELKKHIQFLISNCDKAVEDSKRNIDTEISKINTWVTIWIGVFGLLGIFIPILVNLKSFDSLKEIEKKANCASDEIEEHRDDIEAIKEIKVDVINAKNEIELINKSLPTLSKQSANALNDAKTAISKSELNNKILIAFSAIGKLKKLEKIIFLNRDNPIPLIHSYLSSVHNILKTIDTNHDAHFYSELLEELKERLFELASTTIIKNRNNTAAISNFAVLINSKLISNQNPLTTADHNEIISQFETMLNAIN